MKRKVNRVGQNTLTVSLPSAWVKQYNVNAGDEIDVEESGGTLTINKSHAPRNKEKIITVESKEQFLRRFIVTPYIKGYDTIRVRYQDPEVYTLVQEALNKYLLGFEILEHRKDECVLKNVAEGTNTELESNQRKYLLQVKEVVTSLLEAIEKKDMKMIDHVLIIDQTIDKLSVFMRRILNTQGYKDESKGKSLYYINNLLETVSDNCREVCKVIKRTGRFPPKKFAEILKLTVNSLERYYELFYKWSPEKVVEFNKINKTIKAKIAEIVEAKDPDMIFYFYLLSIANMEHNLSEELE